MPLDVHDQRWLVEQFNEIRDLISASRDATTKSIADAVAPLDAAIHGNGSEGLRVASARHDTYFRIIGTCLVIVGGGVLKALLG
mgnify:CR=1 FL=1